MWNRIASMRLLLVLAISWELSLQIANGFVVSQTSESIHASCGSAESGRYYFPVTSNSPNGLITLFFAQFDANRRLPISTTTYHDAMNHIQTAPRIDEFRAYDCPQLPTPSAQPDCSVTFKMTDAQKSKSGYTAFDRGHMVPVNPYRFHADAVSNTFFCVNIAPQEPYTNQNPWFTVEDATHRRTTAGYVMTGLCSSNSADGVTLDGVQVPSCFWKLLCYKEGSKTHVVGFIGENALFDRNSESGKESRRLSTITPRSQQEVITRNGGSSEIMKAWTTASQNLLGNRQSSLAPTNCGSQLSLDAGVRAEWSNLMREASDEFNRGLSS